jgi:hypothetical protein
MRIDELTGYKQNQIYNKAKTLMSPASIATAMADMRSTEGYSSIKSVRNALLNKFMAFLNEHGFVKLGMGTFGLVFEKPGYPWVFKIFNDDRAYMDYIKYATAHQANPNVPKIKGNLIKIDKYTYAIRIEKLTPFKPAPENDSEHDLHRLLLILCDWRSCYPDAKKFVEDKFPGIYSIIMDLSNDGNWLLDLHEDNIMLRGNTPVLVDPVWEGHR